jgi:hypothetical protein
MKVLLRSLRILRSSIDTGGSSPALTSKNEKGVVLFLILKADTRVSLIFLVF